MVDPELPGHPDVEREVPSGTPGPITPIHPRWARATLLQRNPIPLTMNNLWAAHPCVCQK